MTQPKANSKRTKRKSLIEMNKQMGMTPKQAYDAAQKELRGEK